MRSNAIIAIFLVFSCASYAAGTSHETAPAHFVEWIAAMKNAERGPFKRIRWFCKDGQILPPQPYGCADVGGGSQHGEWSDRTKTLREAGYSIANFYADLDVDEFVANRAASDTFAQMLIEQFLIRADDGWILRRAQFYRGAYQEEGERSGARKLLFKLSRQPEWLNHRYLVLRTAARLLKHGADTASVQEIRQLSASLSDRDPAFKPVRNKIHGAPELADAVTVKNYLAKYPTSRFADDYVRLAKLINDVYNFDIAKQLHALAVETAGIGDIAALANRASARLEVELPAQERFARLANTLAELRDRMTVADGPRSRTALLDTSLVLETELLTLSAALEQATESLSRRQLLGLLGDNLRALYGTGLLSKRQLRAMQNEIDSLRASQSLNAGSYKRALDYLALVPNWSTQALRQFFGKAMDKLTGIEPKANLFVQDHLRGSPMFIYATVIDKLNRDANQLAGVRNVLFGDDVGAGLRALNPGLARGHLRLALSGDIAELDQEGIYLLPETVSELPPVAGILTEGEGNPLSHVQLLARNLGIPNVGVDQSLIAKLKAHEGRLVVLAVSPAGSVQLTDDAPRYAAFFDDDNASAKQESLIKVELDKLDLDNREFLTLSELRAADSGKVVGPKAAKLGELKYHYPEAVAEGLTIPFGIFKSLLDQTADDRGMSVFEWMQSEYRRLESMPKDSAARRAATEKFRAELQATIAKADPGDLFRTRLRAKMIEVFGADGKFGVFVRSDTNVEDLPGFTGAGLNLTVANVVGIDNIIAAISRVWASPFSARSFAWRQTLMDKPEHVYPAVLLMRSVDADKSGVLVTQEIDTGNRDWLSVAVNEGVGGAVDGQSAESLRINTANGNVRLMAAATAAIRRTVDLSGGVHKLPVSTAAQVLKPAEIAQLITLAKQLPDRFPAIIDAAGKPAPADIEFGFLDGELRLFQIRPFLDSDQARGNKLLRELDAPLATRKDSAVALDEQP